MSISRLALLPLLLAGCGSLFGLLGSCAAYEFERQDVLLAHDEEADTLDLLVVSTGLHAPRKDARGSALSQVSADAGGYRHVILLGWPWEFDLPDIEASLSEASDADEDPVVAAFRARALALLADVSVEGAGAFVHGGDLGLYQRIRISGCSRGLSLANDAIHHAIRSADEEGKLEPWLLGWADERTLELWREHAAARQPWGAFEGTALVIRVPLTIHAAAELLHRTTRWSAEEPGVDQLFAPLRTLRVADDEAELLFGSEEDGAIHFTFRFSDVEGPRLEPSPDAGVVGEPPADVLALLRAKD